MENTVTLVEMLVAGLSPVYLLAFLKRPKLYSTQFSPPAGGCCTMTPIVVGKNHLSRNRERRKKKKGGDADTRHKQGCSFGEFGQNAGMNFDLRQHLGEE